MNHVQENTLRVILGMSRYFGKFYCYPTQLTILRHLEDDWGVHRSLRSLNRHLAWLENHEYIKRQRRTKSGEHGPKTFTSTLYKISQKTLFFFGKLKSWFNSLNWNFKDFPFARKAKAQAFAQASKSGKPVQYTKESLLAQEMARQYERNEPPLPLEENLRRFSMLKKALS